MSAQRSPRFTTRPVNREMKEKVHTFAMFTCAVLGVGGMEDERVRVMGFDLGGDRTSSKSNGGERRKGAC